MADPIPAKPEMLTGLGIAGYAVAFELLGLLAEKGIITAREGLQVIEKALASTEEKQSETPNAALQSACDLLGIHQAMFVQPPKGG